MTVGIVAIRKRDAAEEKVLRIANVNEKYTMCTYPADPNQEIDLKNHKWGHYFICGYKGFYEYAKSQGVNVGEPVGLDVVIDGIVPTGSGLSSSAAFVCSATIAIMAVFGLNFPKCYCTKYSDNDCWPIACWYSDKVLQLDDSSMDQVMDVSEHFFAAGCFMKLLCRPQTCKLNKRY